MILDKDIPTADPGELIIQYTPLIYKVANRYKPYLEKLPAVDEEDLLQAGRIGIYHAQKKYDPDAGAAFLTYAFDHVRSMMQRTMRLKADGSLPEEALISLDEPLSEDGDDTRGSFVQDTEPTAEERMIADESHQETADAIHAAIDRLKNDKQREVMRRVWLDGQSREEAAAEMGTTYKALYDVDYMARANMRRDKILIEFAMPHFAVGVNRFRTTWTSATEAAVIWRDEHLRAIIDAEEEKKREQTREITRRRAYLTRMMKKYGKA